MKKANPYFTPSKRPVWLVTFVDLMMIILVLFVLMYSFSVVDKGKMGDLVESFNQQRIFQTGSEQSNGIELDGETQEKLKALLEDEERIQEILTFVETFSQESGFEIDTVYKSTGIELVLPETMLFESGRAEVLPSAQRFLDQLAPLLQNIPNEIKVEGHTDNVPISSTLFPTNWELSTARATMVIRYLTETHGLDPGRFTALGFGENRPLYPNDSAEGRSQNRRVVILLSSEE